jgi:hypothetical protein
MGEAVNEQALQDFPKLLVGFNDLMVLRSVIRGYLACIRRSALPAQERQRQARLLEGVYTRLLGIPPEASEVCLPLAVSEAQALNVAMRGFAAFVRQKVPPTREREETLETLESLRRDLMKTFALFSD